ncbi:unnamed protein product [Pylaiella littoralis]
MLHTRPETNNEARLRDARAEEDIHRIQHAGQLQHKRTEKTADARTATADILNTAANTDRNMAMHHDRIKNSKVDELNEKKAKLEHAEQKYRELINVAWIAFPVTAAVYLCTCTHVFLPDVMKEKKRNAQHKIKVIDAELMNLTSINVRRNFSIGDTVSSSDVDRRYSGSGDPAPQQSVYAPAPAYSAVTSSRPPPAYHAHVVGGAQIHIQ